MEFWWWILLIILSLSFYLISVNSGNYSLNDKTIRKAPRAECARKDMFLKFSRSPTFTHFGV